MSRDRDRILEQAMKHELRAAGTPPAGVCLDAETLGAWMDGGLDPAAVAMAEAHISNCARCQALVGAMARSTPTAAAATEARGFPLWKWWLAPIAAGVTAVTLWMVIPEQHELATAPPPLATTTPAQAPAAAESVKPSPQAPAAALDQTAERKDKLAVDALEARQRSDRDNARKETDPKEEKAVAQMREQAALADAAVPAAPPPAAAARSGAPIAELQKSNRLAFTPIEIPTLDPSLGWRIAGDRIERSDNGGTTWTVKRQNSSDGIVTGSAPSNAVGWFVGRAGRVLLTIDSGATFMDVSLAEPLDLASIAAIDARNASVYSVPGRRFRTDDGGRTWRPF